MFSLRQEAVADSLEELWISYNLIEKLKGIQCMKKLRVLYMSNNLVKEWGELALRVKHKTFFFIVLSWLLAWGAGEFVRLAELPCLADLVFVGNPLEEKHSAEGNWMDEACRRLPSLKKLDGNNGLATANCKTSKGIFHQSISLFIVTHTIR